MAKSVVVDKNFLEHPALENFLASDTENRAVLTDFLAVESFAGRSFKNLTRSMTTLARFPTQIFVLKSSRELAELGPIDPNLRFQMIDWRLTKTFEKFCAQVLTIDSSSQARKDYFTKRAAAAQRRLDKIREVSPGIVNLIQVLRDDTGEELLKARREGRPMPGADGARLLKTIEYLARRFLRDDKLVPPIPGDPLLASRCYVFRMAIAIRILAVWWAQHGGIKDAKLETIRNDLVDITYAVVATYWDGLETLDDRAADIYAETEYLANDFFARYTRVS